MSTSNVTLPPANINTVKCADIEEAAAKASSEAANAGGRVLPAILSRQGSRQIVTTALPINFVRNRIEISSAKPRGTVQEVLSATNRPIMNDHVNNIASYLIENVGGRYILPPMSLNVQDRISLYLPNYSGAVSICYLVVPDTARLAMTDGQHRAVGSKKAWEELKPSLRDQFDQDAITVMITLEDDPSQIHQDFADCSKTKALPKSQLAAYDRRNPANGLVLDLCDTCVLFKDKIDSASKTLSKLSTNLFLTNQVRQLVKELLAGDYALADDAFERKAKELLISNTSQEFLTARDKFKEFVDCVTDAIPIYTEIALLGGLERNRIKDLRSEGYICLTATGLVIIGRIGYELFRDGRSDWKQIATRLGNIDWSRNASIWQGSIVRSGKMATQRAHVRTAAEKVRREIGLPPNEKLNADLAEVDQTMQTAAA
jgi:DNA sulfur modification protein DndB